MRRVIVTLLAASVVGIATPVDAKGPSEVVITGVGLDAAMAIDPSSDPREWHVLHDASRWWEAAATITGTSTAGTTAPTDEQEDLGPRLVFRWVFATGAEVNDRRHLVQHLYPQAPGGPLVHTPSGQELFGHTTAARWHRASGELTKVLRRLGATPTSVEELDNGNRLGRPVSRWAELLRRW